MQFQDMHGHLAPHAELFENADGTERPDPNAGGIAKVATLIKQVRESNPAALLLAVGDTTHGSAETTFTLGDAIMPALNALGIDAFLPGNWDFGYGPRVYRQRFVADDFSTVLAPNNRTTVAWMDGRIGHEDQHCKTPGGLNVTTYATCHVTKANFPTIAINLYNYNEVAGTIITTPENPTGQTHPGYVVLDANGTKVGVIGITSDVVPQQAQAFNTGFRFTMGYKELPQNIAAAKADGAELIVVLSELGLAKNVQLVKEFPEINVMFSGHTHERTPEAIVIDRGDQNSSNLGIVTEAGEDGFLGRLDVKIVGGRITTYKWDLMEANGSVLEDTAIKSLIDQERKTFIAGPDFICHTFGPNAFPFGKGHVLCDPLETVVGHTIPTIERFHVLEETANNVMVDAFLELAQYVDPSLDDGNSLSTTNGFRFDTVILGQEDDPLGLGAITVGDLYNYYPIGAAVTLADFTGGRLIDHWEGILNNVFDPNPYRQRGGWFLGFTHNMHFDIQLNDDFPRTITAGRIDKVTIDDGSGTRSPSWGGGVYDAGNPRKLDRSAKYTLASCYPHGNPVDEVCRTSGAQNVRFIKGTQMTTGATDIFGQRQLDIDGTFSAVSPVNSKDIWDPKRFQLGGPLFLQVAPNDFVHPIDALRRYLAFHDPVDNGPRRVESTCASEFGCNPNGAPYSEYGGEGIVQATQGAGPAWLKREFVTTDNQNQQ
jgi:2',3'-cyclic-nucleotide 2'-phosphodiesterase (5'-nucleotidase family)